MLWRLNKWGKELADARGGWLKCIVSSIVKGKPHWHLVQDLRGSQSEPPYIREKILGRDHSKSPGEELCLENLTYNKEVGVAEWERVEGKKKKKEFVFIGGANLVAKCKL